MIFDMITDTIVIFEIKGKIANLSSISQLRVKARIRNVDIEKRNPTVSKALFATASYTCSNTMLRSIKRRCYNASI